jgi:hypothetical protein
MRVGKKGQDSRGIVVSFPFIVAMISGNTHPAVGIGKVILVLVKNPPARLQTLATESYGENRFCVSRTLTLDCM